MGGISNTIGKITGNDTIGRIGGGLLTGGLSEFGEKNSFGVPANLAGPLKIGAGTIGGGMLGGPAGAFLGGTLGGALGGNTQGGMIGGGLGGLLQSLISGGGGGMDPSKLALGGSLLGLGLSQDTDVQRPQMPSWAQDEQTINAEKGSQQQLIDSLMGKQRGLNDEQNSLLGQRMQAQRDQLMQQMTTGPEGEAFRQKYNNMGMLNSGAFETGLSNQFGNLASQQQQDILNQQIGQNQGLSNILNQGYQTQSDLGQSGLQRHLGLEDTGAQFDLASAIQNAQQKAQLQQSLIGGGAYMLGGGMPGGGGGGAAGGAGGGGGGLFGGDQGFLSSLGGGVGNMISGLLDKFRSPGGSTLPSNSQLSLIPGGSPSSYYGQPMAYAGGTQYAPGKWAY